MDAKYIKSMNIIKRFNVKWCCW